MKKIIFLKSIRLEVNIGDVVEISTSVKVEVTENLIKLNPDLFEIREDIPEYFRCINIGRQLNYTEGRIYKSKETKNYPEDIYLYDDKGNQSIIDRWQPEYVSRNHICFEPSTKKEFEKQELLDKAKRDYPVGIKFICLHSANGNCLEHPDAIYSLEEDTPNNIVIRIKSPIGCGCIYDSGKWAKITPYIFTTDDDIEIYEGTITYMVKPNDDNLGEARGLWRGDSRSTGYKYFYHKENALAYIEKCIGKTLKNYENILCLKFQSNLTIGSIDNGVVHNIRKGIFYSLMKANEPKLYYTKVLQLIADDLNDGWKPDFSINNTQKKWFLDSENNKGHISVNYGLVYFKSPYIAQKARKILGDNIKHLFN